MTEKGTIDLTAFPNPKNVDLLSQYIQFAQTEMRGFSSCGGMYVQFQGGVDVKSLPEVMESTEDWSQLWLMDADEASPTYGKRWPIEWEYREEEGVYLPPNLLMVRPVPGHPLTEGGTFALIVRREWYSLCAVKPRNSQLAHTAERCF